MGDCEGAKFRIGDLVRIYNGPYEDHEFWVASNNYTDCGWEYLYNWPLHKVWVQEDSLILVKPAGIN